MRKLMRSMARHNLEKLGADKLNKKIKGGKSKFARFWREYIFTTKPKARLNTKGARANG